ATPFPAPTVIGFADFLFIALFFAAICRFMKAEGTKGTQWSGYPSMFSQRAYWLTLVVLMATLCAYMLLVFFYGWNLPALVPMAVVMVGLHWRQFHYRRSEVFALIYAALFVVLIVAGFWLLGRSHGRLVPLTTMVLPPSSAAGR